MRLMPVVRLCGAHAVLALAVLASASAVAQDIYTVRSDPDLRALTVTACFDDPKPTALVAAQKWAGAYLRDARWTQGAPVRSRRGRLELEPGHGNCLSYDVDLDGAARAHGLSMQRRKRAVRVVDVGGWLWLPASGASERPLSLRFEMPPGVSVSAPWPPADSESYGYRNLHTHWPARTAFGHFPVAEIDVPGARLRLAVADLDAETHLEKLIVWISANARATATLYGEFPLASPQVLVTPASRAGAGPVPWGQVLRGGYPSVLLTVNTQHDLDAFLEDWTASHEFSHLFFPYITRRQAWLSEGFASYYQNVLRARAGMLTQVEAWQKLHEGFQRGRAGTRGRPLSAATRDMHAERAYMRVYWSGVAVALMADAGIRQASGGQHSLDTALADLRQCCLPADRVWTAAELARHIDASTSTDVFGKLVQRYQHASEFPQVDEVLAGLGVTVIAGQVRLDDDAPLASLRAAITGKR